MPSPPLSCLIIDDDYDAIDILANKITSSCASLSLLAQTTDPYHGIELIERIQPKVVFLDIQMPRMTGFQLLESVKNKNFWVVFTTSYSQYAIRAFKINALDYLLKPVATEDLLDTSNRLLNISQEVSQQNNPVAVYQNNSTELTAFSNHTSSDNLKYITVAHSKGLKMIRFSELVCLKANGSYCEFHLIHERFMASKGLKYFEELLPTGTFFKIHKSSIINIEHLKEYRVDDVGYALMTNGSQLEIARRRKESFVKAIKQLGRRSK